MPYYSAKMYPFRLNRISDVIFPGLFYFPENREFPGIQSNFPGIPGNLIKAKTIPDLLGVIS